MRIMTIKRLRDFWENPKNARAKAPLEVWINAVKKAEWTSFADVKQSFNSADRYRSKTIFDVGGNKFRIVAFVDFEGQRVFIRAVLNHTDYDRGKWKNDPFGDNWKTHEEHKKTFPNQKGQADP